MNSKSQRWDSNLGLGDLTGPLLTYIALLSTSSGSYLTVSGPKTWFVSQAALATLLSNLVQCATCTSILGSPAPSCPQSRVCEAGILPGVLPHKSYFLPSQDSLQTLAVG